MTDGLLFEVYRKSTPSCPADGYGDRGRLYQGANIIWDQDNKVSACPNPLNPHTGAPWDSCYAMAACGQYKGEVIDDTVNGHGICIKLNDLGAVPTILQDMNPNGENYLKWYATQVLVHKGYSLTWRGSMCCITISPDVYDSLFALLPVGTKLTVAIIHGE